VCHIFFMSEIKIDLSNCQLQRILNLQERKKTLSLRASFSKSRNLPIQKLQVMSLSPFFLYKSFIMVVEFAWIKTSEGPEERRGEEMGPKSKSEKFSAEFVMGGAAAIVSKSAAAPIERVKLLLQNQGEMIKRGQLKTPYTGIRDCFKRVFREEGLFSFWRGNQANIIRYFPTQVLLFPSPSFSLILLTLFLSFLNLIDIKDNVETFLTTKPNILHFCTVRLEPSLDS